VEDHLTQTEAAGVGRDTSETTDITVGAVTADVEPQNIVEETTDEASLDGKAQTRNSERDKIEIALRETEQRYRQLVHSLPVAVYTCDREGHITLYNDAAVVLWGREPQLGRDLWCGSWRIYRPDGTPLPVDECPMAIALKEGRAVSGQEIVIERPDGTRRNVLPYPVPMRDRSGTVVGAVNTLVDITEHKAAEEPRARLAAIVDSSDDAIVGKTLDGIITSWNRGAEKIFGYTAAEAIGQHIFLIVPEDKRAEEADVLARLGRGEKIDHFDTIRRTKDGRRIVISLTVSPIRNAAGHIIGASKVARDITERKRMEEELQRLNANLENRVLERTAELVASIAQRENLQQQLLQAQKMESIGTLAGGIAHDFNNILNIIMGYTLLIERNGHQGQLNEALSVIKETVQRAAALVQQLLAIARKTEINFQQIDVGEILQKLKVLLSGTFPKTIDIDSKLHPEIPPIIIDPNQIHQALLNLCVNARDAMPGGGKLLLETSMVDGAELRQRFHQANADRYVAIRVSDTGTGMDGLTKSRIFEPFFTTKAEGQGTGLGLSVVYGIVTNHCGFVDVESEPRQGATFWIYLPLTQEKSATAEPTQRVSRAGGNDVRGDGETVLFVDDEEKQLYVMRDFLESEGYKVLIARDGSAAVELYAQHKDNIAVVILDLGLPKLNGWEAFQSMRKIQPNLNALFATGFLSPEIEAEMKKGRLGGIIRKPYQLNEVLEKISRAIGKQEIKIDGNVGV